MVVMGLRLLHFLFLTQSPIRTKDYLNKQKVLSKVKDRGNPLVIRSVTLK